VFDMSIHKKCASSDQESILVDSSIYIYRLS
jgi:hypothetical protein